MEPGEMGGEAGAGSRAEVVALAMRRLRRERGLNYHQAGTLLGVDGSNVCRAENGQRGPLPAGRVAAAFGVTVAEVLTLCPRCQYSPPAGYMCLRCGTQTAADVNHPQPRPPWHRGDQRGPLDRIGGDAWRVQEPGTP
jgi:hypothetical protein